MSFILVSPGTGGGGGGPITGLTGTPTQVVYIDNAGNGTSDSLFTRDSVTLDTAIVKNTVANKTEGLYVGSVTANGVPLTNVSSLFYENSAINYESFILAGDVSSLTSLGEHGIIAFDRNVSSGETASITLIGDKVAFMGISSSTYSNDVNITGTEARVTFSNNTVLSLLETNANTAELRYLEDDTILTSFYRTGTGINLGMLAVDGNIMEKTNILNNETAFVFAGDGTPFGFGTFAGGIIYNDTDTNVLNGILVDDSLAVLSIGDGTEFAGFSGDFTAKSAAQFYTDGSIENNVVVDATLAKGSSSGITAGITTQWNLDETSARLLFANSVTGVDTSVLAGASTELNYANSSTSVDGQVRLNGSGITALFNSIASNYSAGWTIGTDVRLEYTPTIGDATDLIVSSGRARFVYGAGTYLDINASTGSYRSGDIGGVVSATYNDINATNSTIMDYTAGANRRVVAPAKTLSNNTTTDLFEVALPAGAMTGGTFTVTVIATDGTDVQAHSDIVTYAAVNKAGVYTTDIQSDTANDSVATSAGTLAVTHSITTGTNKVIIRVNANSSLTTTDIKVYFQLDNNDGHVVTLL